MNASETTLITGATGFVGGRLLRALLCENRQVRALSRNPAALGGVDWAVGDLTSEEQLIRVCAGVDVVFHCAGHAHAFASLGEMDARRHWQVNYEGTRNLVCAAAKAGVSRFVFLSSVKALAEPGNLCIDEDFPGPAETDYGQAKRAAEIAVEELGACYGMHVVNLRLAMVYGAGGRGNLERMARLVGRGWFPPLPETGNRRSLVHVDDVVAAMRLVAGAAAAKGRTYIVASHEAPSGRQLFDALRAAQGLPPCAWHVPARVLRLAGHLGDLTGRLARRRMPLDTEVLERLLGSACYSPARIERELGWTAKVSLVDGLKEMLGK